MFDFIIQEPNINTAIFCLISYIVLLIILYKKLIKRQYSKLGEQQYSLLGAILIFSFIIGHCFRGDFFHMMEIVHNYSFIKNAYNYGEEIYVQIAQIVNKNYLLFRTIVWGGSLVIFCICAKRLQIPWYFALSYLCVSYVIIFSYARATAAMSIYFLGISFLLKPINNKKIISYFIASLLIWLCTLFHRSAIILVIITLFSFLPAKKHSIIIITISTIIIAFIIGPYLLTSTDNAILDEATLERIEIYTSNTSGGPSGIGGKLLRIFQYTSFCVPFFYIYGYFIQNNNGIKIGKAINGLFNICLGILLVSFTFTLLGNQYTTFSYRIINMTMIPITLLITKLYTKGLLTSGKFKICLIAGISHQLIRYIYDVYAAIVNPLEF